MSEDVRGVGRSRSLPCSSALQSELGHGTLAGGNDTRGVLGPGFPRGSLPWDHTAGHWFLARPWASGTRPQGLTDRTVCSGSECALFLEAS